MKAQEMQDRLHKELAPLFPGFTHVNDDEGFVRTIPGGVQKILVPLVDYDPLFVFSLVICVRLDEVEKIFNQFAGSPPQYHSMTLTTMTPLRYFFQAIRARKSTGYRMRTTSGMPSANSRQSGKSCCFSWTDIGISKAWTPP